MSFKYAIVSKLQKKSFAFTVLCTLKFSTHFPVQLLKWITRSSVLYLQRCVFCTPCHVIKITTDHDLCLLHPHLSIAFDTRGS